MPVLPLVGSTMCIPGLSFPDFSASLINATPIRHLTEKAGLRLSILASTVTGAEITRLIRTSGVFPIASALLLYTAIPKLFGVGKAESVLMMISLMLLVQVA